MNILITGGNGQLAYDLDLVLSKNHNLYILDKHELDISSFNTTYCIINKLKPDIVINAAAYTKVDLCETNLNEKLTAHYINARGVRNLADVLSAYEKDKIKLIHISTDYVFDGNKAPSYSYKEFNKTNPIGIYGKSKRLGEILLQKSSFSNYIILRTAWLYGIKGHNFFKAILKTALNDSLQKIRVVGDQYGSPTWTYRLAVQIEKLIYYPTIHSVYHASNHGSCNWYEAAVEFLRLMGINKKVEKCLTEDYPTPAKRPKNSILSNDRLITEELDIMNHWRIDLHNFVEQYKVKLLDEFNN